MKTVILTRHARPEYRSGLSDHDLELSLEGKQEELLMIEDLKSQGYLPTVVYHSPLTRTRQTAEMIAEAFGCVLVEESALYEFDFERLMEVIREDEGNCLVFVGHAPNLRELFVKLTGGSGVGVPFQMSSYRAVKIQ